VNSPSHSGGGRIYRFAVPAALTVIAIWLAWPIAKSGRWEITPDPAALQGKAEYLFFVGSLPRPAEPRNVVLIVADDLGRHDVSFMGDSPFRTPALDALASQSTTYENAYATAAICAPSRAALMTGRLQNRFGFESQPMQRYVRNLGEFLGFRYLIDTDGMQPLLLDSYPDPAQIQRQGLPPEEITLAEVYSALGYRTGIFGKWHLGYAPDNQPERFGFDTQYGFTEAFTLYSEPSADIVEHHHDLFWERHIWSMGRSGPSAITRDGQPIDESRYLTDAIGEEATAFIDAALSAEEPFFAYLPFSAPHTPFQARQDDYAAADPTLDHNTRVYAAMIARLDAVIGQLVQHLDQRAALAETIIVFTSDNGGAAYTGATANGPLRGGKFTQFEGGLAVPLLIRWPDGMRREDDRVVLLTDLFATLLEEAGAPLPTDRTFDAKPLQRQASDRHLFWRSDFNLAVRWRSWKLLHDRRREQSWLFDLEADPGETNNLASANPELVKSLEAAIARWEQGMKPARWPRVMNYQYQDSAGDYWFAI
jgi:arylsulfatase A-like enzyme